jgi:hypothetical protein
VKFAISKCLPIESYGMMHLAKTDILILWKIHVDFCPNIFDLSLSFARLSFITLLSIVLLSLVVPGM